MNNSRMALITLVSLSIVLFVASIFALSKTADMLFPGSEELTDAPSHHRTRACMQTS